MGKLDPQLENIFAQAMDIADANERAVFVERAGEFIKAIASTVLVMLLAGCATVPPIGRADLLDFLVDGNTAKEEVLMKLGRPSGTFAAEETFTYRLGFESKGEGYWVVGRETDASPWPIWKCARYSLVLVFNDHDILQSHSLVNIKATGP